MTLIKGPNTGSVYTTMNEFQSVRWKEPADGVGIRAGIAGSKPAKATTVSILLLLCVVSQSGEGSHENSLV